MEERDIYEIYVQPIMFKTISFHHKAQYIIKFKFTENNPIRTVSILPSFSLKKRKIDHRTGNIDGIGGKIISNDVLETGKIVVYLDRFPIDYNEQCVKFTTGMWQQFTPQEHKPIPLQI